jgi:hypothetical protein
LALANLSLRHQKKKKKDEKKIGSSEYIDVVSSLSK